MEQIINTLEDLTTEEFKKFKFFLTDETLEGFQRIPRRDLENANDTDVATKIRDTYGIDGSLKITLHILKKMKHHNLADKLERELKKR